MTVEQFEKTLRELLHRKPFQPFVVELLDGRFLQILRPKVVFNGGGASFFASKYDLVEFTCEEVRAFRLLVPGAPV